jgi:hypothetical protein
VLFNWISTAMIGWYEVQDPMFKILSSTAVSVVAGLRTGWAASEPSNGPLFFDGTLWQFSAAGKPFFTLEKQLPPRSRRLKRALN